jgi:hypothetical protein
MDEQPDALNGESSIIDIALKYTNDDLEKAKEMAADQYFDVIVVKGRFIVEKRGYSGMFLAFFNYINEYIANVSSIISSKTELYDSVNVFNDWKTLHKDLMIYKQGTDMVDSQNFNYFLIDSFVTHDVFPDVREKNKDDLTNTFHDIISKSLNVDTVECEIEFESTSSLAMNLAGVPIDLPGGESKETIGIPEDERITKIESEAKYVIAGEALVAPVKGKNINELYPGDKIKLLLPGKDVVSDKILKLLNAYDSEGVRLPVTGRIKAVVPNVGGGFILYAFVAKGVLAKIYEEENVKIMLDKLPAEVEERKAKMENWVIYVMAALVGLIIICGIFLYRIL